MKTAETIRTSRHDLTLVLANLIVFAFIAYLLFSTLSSHQKLIQAAEKRFAREAENQARNTAYFITERLRDLERLASSAEVQAYFQNKALGVSYQYGLRASLSQITSLFKRLLSEKTQFGNNFFLSLVLIDKNGLVIIADSTINEAGVYKKPLFLASRPQINKQQQALVEVPVLFKSTTIGHIQALIDLSQLNSGVDVSHRGFKAAFILPENLKDSHIESFNVPEEFIKGSREQLLYKNDKLYTICRIPDTGLNLAMVTDANEISGNYSHFQMILGFSTVMCMIFFMLIGIIRRNQLENTERSLYATQKQFQSLISNIPGVTFRYLHKNDIFKRTDALLSSYCETLCGYTADDLSDNPDLNFADIIHSDDRQQVHAAINLAVSEKKPWEIEYRLTHKNGDLKWVFEKGHGHLDTTNGSIILDGLILDNTDRKNAQLELQNYSRLQEFLTEISTAFISLPLKQLKNNIENSLGQMGRFVEADRAYIFSYDLVNQVCNNTHEWCGKDISPQIEILQNIPLAEIPEWTEKHTKGEPVYIESVLKLDKENRLRKILEPQGIKSLIAVPLMDGENCTGFAGFDSVEFHHIYTIGEHRLLKIFSNMLVSINKRQEIEDALRLSRIESEKANKAKSEFLANMSHEIRTPLNAIIGFAQILERDKNFDQKQTEHIRSINRSGQHLLMLINDILDMSKIEAGRMSPVLETFSPADLLSDLELMFKAKADNKRLVFSIEKPGKLPAYVLSDEPKIRQILVNLLGNALKFTESGGILLMAHFTPNDQNNSKGILSFSVIDTGLGIPETEQKSIFEAFKQSEAGKRIGGTGLGLAISNNLALLLNGRITIQSRPVRGSCFTLEIPVIEVSGGEERQRTSSGKIKTISCHSSPLKVLIVDDHLDNRNLLTALLEPCGFLLQEAVNGKQAVELSQNWQPDLILMDLRMPEMDGWSATENLRNNFTVPQPKIVAVTASAFEEDHKAAINKGFDGYIRKPFKPEIIFEEISRHVKVDCLYEQVEEVETDNSQESNLDYSISGVPSELVSAMRESIETGDMNRLQGLIDKLFQLGLPIAEHIRNFARNYDYESLTRILETPEDQ